MPKWMIKGNQLKQYLKDCKEGNFDSHSFSNMFNSPNQYKTVTDRLVDLFGTMYGLSICEIGGGYGGQAKDILDRYILTRYHIIDLLEVCELQRRYLKDLPVECFTEPTGQEYDLVISNYAISEIPDNKLYIDEILRKSKRGYITCNTDFVKLDWPHKRLPDIPGERETNYVLIW